MKIIRNNFTDPIIRSENENFNREYIKSRGLKFTELRFSDVPSLKGDNHACQVVWLKNIDRLMELLPKNYDLEDYRLIDIGCGAGISTLYCEENYKLKAYAGFDFEEHLISKSLENKSIASKNRQLEIDFFVQDAFEFSLPQTRSFLFLFNSFGGDTLNKFLSNNLETLRKTNSIIGYINDVHINIFTELDCVIRRNDYFNISLIEF